MEKILSAPGTTYTPVAPYSASLTSVLSQDTIQTDTIVVDSTSASPTAPFLNPNSAGTGTASMEALVITNGQLGHAARSAQSEAGWVLLTPAGGVAAREVAAGTTYAGTADAAVYGLYQDETSLHVLQLQSDGQTWSTPVSLSTGLNSSLRSAYSPNGKLVVYAQTAAGDLLIASQPQIGGAFTTQTYTMPNALANGDYFLALTSEVSWTLAANAGGDLWIYTGTLDGTSTTPNSGGPAANYTGKINQVVFGYWSDYQSALIFLFVDSNAQLQTWISNNGNFVEATPPAPGSTIVKAAGHLYVSNAGIDSIHVYTIDDAQNLAVLHQDPATPWNQDGTPNWAAYLPLDNGIGSLATDGCAADTPTVFALTGDDYSLRLHQQDPLTQMWLTGPVLQAGTASYEVTRYRTEINIIDAAAVPLPFCPVRVLVAPGYSGVDLWVSGNAYPITSNNGAELQTDATGKLTIALLTTAGLAAPELIVTAANLPQQTVQPAAGVHTYLSGTGTLNPTNPLNPATGAGPLPVFDPAGATLQSAVVNGKPLSPAATGNAALSQVAASAIQQTALVGLNQTAPGVTGYKVSFDNPAQPTFQLLTSSAEVQAHVAALRSAAGGIFSGIGNFFSDLWEGIKNGLVAIKDFVTDIVNKVVTFTVQIGNEIKAGIQLALQGLEQAAHFIAGVFQALEADVEDVINWLKALFDFGAIWRTKIAFEQLLSQVPAYINSVTAFASKAANGWFSKQEQTINDAFATIIKKYQGQSFGSQPNFQPAGSAPDNKTKIAGGATAADFNNNVHHNWLQNKVASYGSGSMGLSADNTLQTPLQAFTSNFTDAAGDFIAALTSFAAAVKTTIQDPKDFGAIAIPDFLTAVQLLVDSLLHLLDGILQGFIVLSDAVMDSLNTLLNTPIKVKFLESLWSWVATAAGYPDDNKLTVAALISLFAAFPTTIIYKLIKGVNEEPYPPQSAAALGVAPGFELAAGILQCIYTAPAMLADYLNATCPPWLSLICTGMSVLIFAVGYGLVPVDGMEWYIASIVAFEVGVLSYIIYIVLQSVIAAFINWMKSNTTLFNDIVNGLLTAYGVLSFIAHVVYDALSDPDKEKIIGGLILPLPSIVSFCNLSYYRDDPEVAPFALGAKLAFDVVGYLGAGICEIVDAAVNIHDAPQQQ